MCLHFNMRINFLVATVLILMSYCFSVYGGIWDNNVAQLMEEFRKRMCHPIPKWGLPALDPFKIAHAEIGVNNKYLENFSSSVTGAHLAGLSDFVINDIKITTIPLQRFSLDLTFPLTTLETVYSATGSVASLVNLSGNGSAWVSVEQVRVLITGRFKPGFFLNIRNLKITITIRGIKVNFDQLTDEERIDDFIHALINELGIELLDDVWKAEGAFIEGILQRKLNEILGSYSLSTILSVIKGDLPLFGPNDPPGDCESY